MKLLTTILLLISINIAHADNNEGIIPKLIQYDVEVIIFEDAQARYINSEDWPQEVIAQSPVEEEVTEPPENLDALSIDEINAMDESTPPPFENIKPEILNKEYKRINASGNYNVLFYGSWRQPGLDAQNAFDIDIQELVNNHEVKSDNSISGSFKLVLARYLHIYSKLNYQRKLTTEQAVEETDTATGDVITRDYKNYPIVNHRRMRSKELHYIDHPLVGMLIQINPAKAHTEETSKKSKK